MRSLAAPLESMVAWWHMSSLAHRLLLGPAAEALMHGINEFPDAKLVEHMEQILYSLNLLSCSWAAISCGVRADMHAHLSAVPAQIWCHCHRW